MYFLFTQEVPKQVHEVECFCVSISVSPEGKQAGLFWPLRGLICVIHLGLGLPLDALFDV